MPLQCGILILVTLNSLKVFSAEQPVESCQQTMVQIIWLLCKSIGLAIITPETNIFLNLSSAQHFAPFLLYQLTFSLEQGAFQYSKIPNDSVLPSGTFFFTQCFVFICFCTLFCICVLFLYLSFWGAHLQAQPFVYNPCLLTKIDNSNIIIIMLLRWGEKEECVFNWCMEWSAWFVLSSTSSFLFQCIWFYVMCNLFLSQCCVIIING